MTRPTIVAFAALAAACTPAAHHDAAVQSMLTDVAAQQRHTAEQTLAPRDFAAAADAYEQLLQSHPDLAPEHRWHLADSQMRAGRYQAAAHSFESLVGTPYEDAAVYMSYRCWHLLAFRDQGIGEQAEWGTRPLTASESAFVQATARILAHDFGRSTPRGAPDYTHAAERARPAVLLDAASLLVRRNLPEAARPMLVELVQQHSGTPHATEARLLLDQAGGS